MAVMSAQGVWNTVSHADTVGKASHAVSVGRASCAVKMGKASHAATASTALHTVSYASLDVEQGFAGKVWDWV